MSDDVSRMTRDVSMTSYDVSGTHVMNTTMVTIIPSSSIEPNMTPHMTDTNMVSVVDRVVDGGSRVAMLSGRLATPRVKLVKCVHKQL